MASSPNRFSVYLALVGCCGALLLAVLALFADVEREREAFAASATAIYGRLAADTYRNQDAVRDLAAFVEVEGSADREPVSDYARRIMNRHPQALLFGLLRENPPNPKPEGFAPGAGPESGGAVHLTVLAEAEGARRVFSLELVTRAALREILGRARTAHGVAPGRVLARDGWGHVRLLAQRVAEGGRESFVLAVCRLPGVPAGERGHWSVALREAARPGGEPAEVRLGGTASRPDPLAGAVLPVLRFRRVLEGPAPGAVLDIEQALDWDSLDEERLSLLLGLAGLCLAAFLVQERALYRLERRAREEGDQLFRLANFDALTGLPNRRLFHNRLERALASARRTGQQHALLYLDLDGFKQVNDRFGHEVGDKVLQRAARIFLNRVRETDTVARLGGDEFVILLTGVAGRRGAELVADKIKSAFVPPPGATDAIGKSWPVLGTSVGIAVYPEDGKTATELLRAADRPPYHDKADGRRPAQPMTLAG